MKDKIVTDPQRIKTPREELEVLSVFADTQAFTILKRVARRYAENLKTFAFSLDPTDPQFAVKHTKYREQAVGMQILIKIIAEARAEIAKMEHDE